MEKFREYLKEAKILKFKSKEQQENPNKKTSHGDMLTLMKELKVGDTVIVYDGKKANSRVVSTTWDEYKKLGSTKYVTVMLKGAKKDPRTRIQGGSIQQWDDKAIVWQPTMMTPVKDVEALEKK